MFIALFMAGCRREVEIGLFIVNLEMMPFRSTVRFEGEVGAGPVPDLVHRFRGGSSLRLLAVLFDETMSRNGHGDEGDDEQGKMLVHALPLTDLFF